MPKPESAAVQAKATARERLADGLIPNAGPGREAPDRWKTASLTLLAFFPVFMLAWKFVNPGLRALGVDGPLATFVDCALGVALTAWPLLPLAVKLFSPWIFPAGQPQYVKYAALLALAGCYALEVTVWNVFG